jgi:hypothetical protein
LGVSVGAGHQLSRAHGNAEPDVEASKAMSTSTNAGAVPGMGDPKSMLAGLIGVGLVVEFVMRPPANGSM